MERLTESKIKSLKESMKSNLNFYFYNDVMKVFDELLEYRHLEEQGLLLKLPCKVGDTVWTNESEGKQFCGMITFITIMNSRDDMGGGFINVAFNNGHSLMQFDFSDIGKTVFLTKAEAEKALAEMEK